MILNTGSRTDTVQYYTKWLLKRFDEGFVYSRNPMFQNKVTRYELNPEVLDCVIFCSKNYEPILKDITKITNKFNTCFHYTITAYGKDTEPNVPAIDKSIETLMKLSEIVGKERVIWRYDPILLTEKYTKTVHYETFNYMAGKLSPHVNRCIFSFVEMYKKLKTNMPEIILLSDSDKEILAKGLGEIAKRHNILIQTCGTHGDYTKYGINKSGCMTLDILGKANGVEFRELKHKGMRAGCNCIESRDIGAYETCINGCRYCYANLRHSKAIENFKLHDENSPLLIGEIKEGDEIINGNQKSFLKKDGVKGDSAFECGGQISLF